MLLESASPLEMLPLELLCIIGKKLKARDIKQLRLTCHHLSGIFAQDVLQSITIRFHGGNTSKELSTLQLLASGRSRATRLTKWLCIRSLSPRVPLPSRRGEPNEGAELLTEEEFLAAEAEIRTYLGPALSALKNVQSVRWFPNCAFEERWMHAEVEGFLKSTKSIRQFEMSEFIFYPDNAGDAAPVEQVRVPWTSMTQLNTIRLSGLGPGEQHHPNFVGLSNIIGQFKSLEGIDLDALGHPEDSTNDLLDRLLHRYPTSTESLSLRHVSLSSSNPILTTSTLAHLRNLNSLTLNGHGIVTEDRITILNSMWATLMHEGILLDTIRITEPVAEFLNYVDSYLGIKTLQINPSHFFFPSAELSDAMAHGFFKSIGKHRHSLEALFVSGYHNHTNNWVFSASNASVFSACHRLQKCGISLKGLVRRKGKLNTKVLTLLMDTFLPLLDMHTLSVRFAEPQPQLKKQHEGFRGFIRDFRLPSSQPVPFSIDLDRGAYEPMQDSLGEYWLYHVE